jgi:hypothetical protein
VWLQVKKPKKCLHSCCTLLQVFNVKIFSNVISHRKKCEGTENKNKPDLQSFDKEIFSEPLMRKKNKTEKENSCSSQPPSSGINIPNVTLGT